MKRITLIIIALCYLSMNVAAQKKTSSVSNPSKTNTTKATNTVKPTIKRKTATSAAKKSKSLTQQKKNVEKIQSEPTTLVNEEIAQSELYKHEGEDKVFDVVEQAPSFPGGQGALMNWIRENLRYPVDAAENGISGKVQVQFVIGKDGSISNAKVIGGVDPSLDKEALRVVNSMPKWTPGKTDGRCVNVRYTLPVVFRFQ